MKTKTLYKYLRTGLESESGAKRKWTLGEWREESKIEICKRGFHASKTPLQALSYVKGEILAEVEVRGDSIVQDDKECWSEMRVTKAWNWTKLDSVALAIFAAELVIGIFEKKYPEDKRPRKAIEAAKKYLENPTQVNAAAAHAAAYAAYDATYAAYDAYDATYAAYAAAHAAHAAYDAAHAAHAAHAALTKKINAWFKNRIKTLTPYEL